MKMKDRKILLPGAMIWFSWKEILESISVEDTFQIFDYFLGDLEDEDGEVMRYLGTNYLRLFSYFLIWPEEYTQHKNHKEIAEAIVAELVASVDWEDALHLKDFAYYLLNQIKEEEKKRDRKLLKLSNCKTEV